MQVIVPVYLGTQLHNNLKRRIIQAMELQHIKRRQPFSVNN